MASRDARSCLRHKSQGQRGATRRRVGIKREGVSYTGCGGYLFFFIDPTQPHDTPSRRRNPVKPRLIENLIVTTVRTSISICHDVLTGRFAHVTVSSYTKEERCNAFSQQRHASISSRVYKREMWSDRRNFLDISILIYRDEKKVSINLRLLVARYTSIFRPHLEI